jgi:hypothetical protein
MHCLNEQIEGGAEIREKQRALNFMLIKRKDMRQLHSSLITGSSIFRLP